MLANVMDQELETNEYISRNVSGKHSQKLVDLIILNWTHQFMINNNIFPRLQTEKN